MPPVVKPKKSVELRPARFGAPYMPGGSILIHGIYNTGKTKLGAAAIKYFSEDTAAKERFKVDPKVSFFSFDEEQGESSAAGMGLEYEDLGYQCLYEGNTIEEFEAWVEMIEREKRYAVCVDSLWAWYRAIQRKKTGGDRPPKAGDHSDNEWPWIHNDASNIMTRLRKSCTWVIVLSPSDTGQNVIKSVETGGMSKKIKVTPDLNGKMGEGCIAWFNLVGYLMLDEFKQGTDIKYKRTLDFGKSINYVTRQRMPYPIEEKIDIPDGDPGAAWSKLMSLANASYAKAFAETGGKK